MRDVRFDAPETFREGVIIELILANEDAFIVATVKNGIDKDEKLKLIFVEFAVKDVPVILFTFSVSVTFAYGVIIPFPVTFRPLSVPTDVIFG